MSKQLDDPARRCLPVAEWPEVDRAAWQRALLAARGPFREDGGGPSRSPASIRKYQGGYGRWLGFLAHIGDLAPSEIPAKRPTPARLDQYFDHLCRCGNADYTIVGRFAELRAALQMMTPGRR